MWFAAIPWFACTDDALTGAGPTGTDTGEPRIVAPFPTDPVPKRSVPLVGGLVALDLEWVAASDVDGDRLRLVRLATDESLDVPLPAGWAPTQLAWTSGLARPRLHVLLRGTGSVGVVDPGVGAQQPLLVNVVSVCDTPRGLAWDLDRAQTWVACGGGELVGVDPDGAVVERFPLEPDLRDVVTIGDGRAMVSRTKAAEVLVVDLDDGAITQRWTVGTREIGGSSTTDAAPSRILAPHVLKRLVPDGTGGALGLVQYHDTGPIDVDPGGTTDPDPPPAPAYGGGCEGNVVLNAYVQVRADSGIARNMLVDTEDTWLADLIPVAGDEPLLATTGGISQIWTEADEAGCFPARLGVLSGGLATAVATLGAQTWVVNREPFALWKEGGIETEPVDVPFVPLADRPLARFHDAPSGIACASCHFDGDEDGHTYTFVPGGPRRTQPLGGLLISETAPYHWDATFSTFDGLFADVGLVRMGLDTTNTEVLLTWIDGLPRPPPTPPDDPAAVPRGAELFSDPAVGCASCHAGWRYSDGGSADVGTGGTFQVPSLLGVGGRAPLMHDGCAPTLRARFDDPACGGDRHGGTAGLTDAEIDALVSFLQTL